MKAKRRMTAIALAACMLGSIAPLGASAAEYVAAYDANQDGSVTINDVIMISQYLMGCYYVDDPSTLDADQNLVINSVDALCIQSHLVYSRLQNELISEVPDPTE